MTNKILLCFAMITLTSLSADAAEIRLRSDCHCREALVRLQDVADVTDLDPAKAARLAKSELFPTPSRVKTLRQRELQELLGLAEVDVSQCQFSGAAAVTIHPPAEQVALTTSKGRAKPLGSAARKNQPQPLVVVAVRPLRKGEVVRAADIELQPAAGAVQAAIYRVEEVVGKEATRALAAGQPLDAECVRRVVLVKRGEAVRVIAKAAGVRIRTTARAAQDGGQGDLVEVQPLDGKQRYTARVVGHQEVEVYAQGPGVGE